MRQPDSMQTYVHILQSYGWDPSAIRVKRTLRLEAHLEEEPAQARIASVMHNGEAAAALFVIDGARFPSGMTLYQRFIDMTIEGRLALRAVSLLAPAPYVFVASPYECFLYDATTEELLLSATSPEDSALRIFSLFKAGEDWAHDLERIPRRSAQQWGKDLSDWLRVWAVKIGRAARISPEAMKYVLAHWVLAWKDTLAGTADKSPDYMNAVVEAAEDPAVAIGRMPVPSAFYEHHVQGVIDRFPSGIFSASGAQESRMWLDDSITSLLAEFLAEARLLSRSKFASGNVLYALTDESTEKKTWRKSLTEKVHVAHSLHRSDLTVYDPLILKVAQDGYGWGLTLLDDLTRYWLEENLRRKEEAGLRGGLNVQLDLFAPSPAGLNANGFLDNILDFIVSHCFRVQVASAEERFNAALLVALKLYEIAEAYSLPLGKFELFDSIFA